MCLSSYRCTADGSIAGCGAFLRRHCHRVSFVSLLSFAASDGLEPLFFSWPLLRLLFDSQGNNDPLLRQ